MSSRNLVTGVTGFVGSHLAYRLLENGDHVIALARGSRNESPRDRVLEVLRSVAGQHRDFNAHLNRLEVLEGDISQPRLGLSDEGYRHAAASSDAVWHCAASLSFEEEQREEIFRLNVGGTLQVLDLVFQTPTRNLHHVSTAYVAGMKDFSTESEINTGQTFRNPYEESKCKAETLVADAHAKGRIVARVYRPSIVIGDSDTGRATHFHGVLRLHSRFIYRRLKAAQEESGRRSGASACPGARQDDNDVEFRADRLRRQRHGPYRASTG
jgi:thioester reductase-like protein